ncbi:hypothetical protein FW758_08305 [Shewanella sp. 1180_01]
MREFYSLAVPAKVLIKSPYASVTEYPLAIHALMRLITLRALTLTNFCPKACWVSPSYRLVTLVPKR